jgi:hypothetical protein
MQIDGNNLFIPEFGRACQQGRAGRSYQRVRPPNSREAANIAAGNCSACRPAPLEPEWCSRACLTAPHQKEIYQATHHSLGMAALSHDTR